MSKTILDNLTLETVSYTYDQYGNKESMTYPDGRTVWYTYDAAGRRIKTENSTLTTIYEYDMVGNLIRQETDGLSRIAFSYNHNKNGYRNGLPTSKTIYSNGKQF